jgi:hypothetical protein
MPFALQQLLLPLRDENTMRLLDQENTTLEDAGFQDDDSILAEIRSRYYDSPTHGPNI